ncbi:MAG TPA: phytanoyl-CoA dioxygenase family protein [Thermoanaerobaculia bacterium]|nr:phytanoyl-CoA dioxygenase family protein [Thermoanaerobaculia bacterium]
MSTQETAAPTMALTAAEVQFFKEEGYLILEDFFEPELVERWQRETSEYFGADPRDDGSWSRIADRRSVADFEFSAASSLRNHAGLQDVMLQLGGSPFELGSEQLIVLWPALGREHSLPQRGHIDRFFPFSPLRFMLGVTTYAFEVAPGGGGTVLWPRSHLANWEYFQTFPEHYYGQGPQAGTDYTNGLLSERATSKPLEFTARPGTVLLWHSFMLHVGSMNVREMPRIGVFYRWGQQIRSGEPRESFGDIWENWAI